MSRTVGDRWLKFQSDDGGGVRVFRNTVTDIVSIPDDDVDSYYEDSREVVDTVPILQLDRAETNELLRVILTGPPGPTGAVGPQGARGRDYDEGAP